MGFMDKIKGLLKGREKQAKSGIDTVSDKVEEKVPEHAAQVDAASQKAKEAVDSLTGNDASPSATNPQSSIPTEPPPVTPPA